MPWIVLSPDPKMQAKRKSIQQELDMENGYKILETKKPKLKGAKYVRECYARRCLQLKKQQAQFWKLINEANDQMQDKTIHGIHSTKQLRFLICNGNQIMVVILWLAIVMINSRFGQPGSVSLFIQLSYGTNSL